MEVGSVIPLTETSNSRWELEITEIALQLTGDVRLICVQSVCSSGDSADSETVVTLVT
jgi:hypothetical protein